MASPSTVCSLCAMARRSWPRSTALALVALCAVLDGCGLLRKTAEVPAWAASAVSPDKKPTLDPNIMRAALQRFADRFAVEMAVATTEFAQRGGTAEAQLQALQWRLEYTSILWNLAAGQHAYASLFDSIITISFLRDVHEKRWSAQWGEADEPMLTALKELHGDIWALAGKALSPEQMEEVHRVVLEWLENDPKVVDLELTKLPGFSEIGEPKQGGQGVSAVFTELSSLMSVDPLSGLEPAVREVERSRQLMERVFYYFQRLPELLSVRVELLVQRTIHSPDVRSTLDSFAGASQAAQSLADTAAALPERFAAEREAALMQISNELTAQRAGLVQDLETSREPLGELLQNTRATVEASRAMSEQLTETLRVLDSFVGRFDKGDQERAEPAEPRGRPFDITEYGATAEQIGVAAQKLGETVATLDRSLPELQRMLDEAAERGARTVDHAFVRGLELLGVALVGGAIAVLVVRRVSLRWKSAKSA